MNCCQCQGIEDLFNQESVKKDLARYRTRGPAKTTRMLVDALKAENVEGLTLLDIGGGVGAIQHGLLNSGAEHATDIEASTAYLSVARSEAERRGLLERITYQRGNFVDLAAQIPPADIVTLDRVICCYHDMQNLVGLSVARANRLYGLVFPRDTWWVKAVLALQNWYFKLRRTPFRTFAHPTPAVEAIVMKNGFQRRFYRKTLVWQVVVYAR